jgi:hypothetical protein
MDNRNIFIYWVGKDYNLVSILRNLIYLHSTSGNGYTVHFINKENINEYIKELPDFFENLKPAHQADYVRVNVICDYGGIWLDSDTIVMESLDPLFEYLEKKDGFFIRENNEILWNGVFGSKKSTPLMLEWKKQMNNTLHTKKHLIEWTEIGNIMLEDMHRSNKQLYSNYEIFNGLDNMYPCNWDACVNEFVLAHYDNYKNIIRPFQPLIVLVNSVYKALENYDINDILRIKIPLQYFIYTSFKNINQSKISNIIRPININNNKEIFENIYRNQIWNNNNNNIPLSGPGSTLENTVECSNALTHFIYSNNCKSILDLGCGDLTWISKTPFFQDLNIEYTGIDIVDSLIKSHLLKYPNRTFICYDITTNNDIKHASLIILRDVIFHLIKDDIVNIFENIRNKFDFIAITSCKNNINSNVFDKWHFSERNIHLEPFKKLHNYIVRIDEPQFNRYMYIYTHKDFYN